MGGRVLRQGQNVHRQGDTRGAKRHPCHFYGFSPLAVFFLNKDEAMLAPVLT